MKIRHSANNTQFALDSGGAIEVHTNRALGDAVETVQSIRNGTIAFFTVSSANLTLSGCGSSRRFCGPSAARPIRRGWSGWRGWRR